MAERTDSLMPDSAKLEELKPIMARFVDELKATGVTQKQSGCVLLLGAIAMLLRAGVADREIRTVASMALEMGGQGHG